jgi:hypothetical protein
MPVGIDRVNPNGSLRIHTNSTRPRTSSNRTFQEQFKDGLKNGISLTDSALRQVTKPIPGSAALTASLSNAANNLNTGSKLDGSNPSLPNTPGSDINSLEEEFVHTNQELLDKQIRLAQITTVYTTESNLVKTYFDTERNIIQNMRT